MAERVPSISAVIPTLGRVLPVVRAVRSALAQTLAPMEVIVVLDGPDEATMRALGAMNDSRVRVKSLPSREGSSGARNAGVDAARGSWIAMLDDDDEWLPAKLEIQMQAARQSASEEPVISCRLIRRSPTGDVVLPRRAPRPGEPVSEYLFRRTRLSGGEGLIQSSTLLAPRALMRRIPFRPGLKRHDDLDWILRAAAGGSTPEFVATPEPLVIWHQDGDFETVSGRKDWRFSFSWIRECRALVTPRAYASYILTWLSENAMAQADRSAFWPLLREAFRNGRPSPLDGVVFSAIWLMPPRLRRRLAAAYTARLAVREHRAWAGPG